MLTPPFLHPGDKVGITAPARWIDQHKYSEVISIIERNGYEVVRGTTTYLTHGPFAGTDQERADDFQQMVNDNSIRAIFCLRGGYGTIRMVDAIDFKPLQKHPKWIIGFSDITILHNQLHLLGIASIHGQMPLNFYGRTQNNGLDQLFSLLAGQPPTYEVKTNANNRVGSAEGPLVGGNVAILCSLVGTRLDNTTEGKILFIEEVGEYLYRFDRMMHQLKQSGKLASLAGLIVGSLSEMMDNDPAFPITAHEIVSEAVRGYNYPVCFDFPAGHIPENYPLIFGKKGRLIVDSQTSRLIF